MAYTHTRLVGVFTFWEEGKITRKEEVFWYFLCCCVFLCVLSVHHFSYWPSETSFSLLVSDYIPRVQSQIVICRSFNETTKFRFLYNKNIRDFFRKVANLFRHRQAYQWVFWTVSFFGKYFLLFQKLKNKKHCFLNNKKFGSI